MYLSGHKDTMIQALISRSLKFAWQNKALASVNTHKTKYRWFLKVCGTDIRNVERSRRVYQRWAWGCGMASEEWKGL